MGATLAVNTSSVFSPNLLKLPSYQYTKSLSWLVEMNSISKRASVIKPSPLSNNWCSSKKSSFVSSISNKESRMRLTWLRTECKPLLSIDSSFSNGPNSAIKSLIINFVEYFAPGSNLWRLFPAIWLKKLFKASLQLTTEWERSFLLPSNWGCKLPSDFSWLFHRTEWLWSGSILSKKYPIDRWSKVAVNWW